MKFVISLGGSIINPGTIDIEFLKEFKALVEQSNHAFVIVCGGGVVAREYQKAAREFDVLDLRLDEIGIKATEINAELVASIVGVRRARLLEEVVSSKDKVVVTNGLFPGVTTDFDSVVIAGLIGADTVINVSNIDGIYDKDPSKNKDAKLLKKMTYDELIKLATEFSLGAGAHFVFDLAAAKLAQRSGIKIISLKGIENLKKAIEGKEFVGTTVV